MEWGYNILAAAVVAVICAPSPPFKRLNNSRSGTQRVHSGYKTEHRSRAEDLEYATLKAEGLVHPGRLLKKRRAFAGISQEATPGEHWRCLLLIPGGYG